MRASGLGLADAAIARGVATADGRRGCNACMDGWLGALPPDWELWLDGGHNPGAGEALAAHLHAGATGRSTSSSA